MKVSVLAFGSWITFADQAPPDAVRECLAIARQAGVTLFDTAETYAGGRAELLLGEAIRDLGWERSTYLISTKAYWGLHDWPHLRTTLNRKYLLQAVDGCLERLGTPFVDLFLCHRRDPGTPIDEVVWAMSDIVASGKALYWGTSEWPAEDVRAAWEVADRYLLRKPVLEQPEYNLLAWRRVEAEYPPLVTDLGLGLMTWSPLGSGILTGKYRAGVPAGSRGALPGYDWLRRALVDPEHNAKVAHLQSVAREVGCSPAQLAIAWCTLNPSVSSVIIGASGPAQLRHDLEALDVVPHLTPDVTARIDRIFR